MAAGGVALGVPTVAAAQGRRGGRGSRNERGDGRRGEGRGGPKGGTTRGGDDEPLPARFSRMFDQGQSFSDVDDELRTMLAELGAPGGPARREGPARGRPRSTHHRTRAERQQPEQPRPDGRIDLRRPVHRSRHHARRRFDLADIDSVVPRLAGSTPLWLYILREAELESGGAHLGAVGGRIVGEVLIGLLELDPTSILNTPGWSPTLDSVGGAGSFAMTDLLTIAGVDPVSRGQ